MRKVFSFLLVVLMTAVPHLSTAQFKDQGIGGGIGFGGAIGDTELKNNDLRFSARAFLRYGLISHVQGEVSVGIAKVGGNDYRTLIVPVEYRFVLSPLSVESWNPFLYAGFGGLYQQYEIVPNGSNVALESTKWSGFIPVGVGAQFLVADNAALEMSGGYNYTLDNKLDAIELDTKKDAYWLFSVGLTVVGESGSSDPDHDGLTNAEEKELGTDKNNADTDGDGLNDGDEIHRYNTSPLKADSDGDGLNDGAEVNTHNTDPTKADTDGDGLSDGDEVKSYNADPRKSDSDGDGLSDGEEVKRYGTNPLKADTDGDGLNDGEEVLRTKTDPKKADSDGGSVNDGVEVGRGTDPLNSADDIKKKELVVEVGKAIVLEGIVFETGSAMISDQSAEILEEAYNTLKQNQGIEVEIRGYTDNRGSRSLNLRLSQSRADAVKVYLVDKGIDAGRISAKGFGPDNPAASNATSDGRQKNRRIEFFRSK